LKFFHFSLGAFGS